MNNEYLPMDLTKALLPTVKWYEDLGLSEIEIGWPTASISATNTVFVHATLPSGRRVHALFEDNADLIGRIDSFLNASSSPEQGSAAGMV